MLLFRTVEKRIGIPHRTRAHAHTRTPY